MAIASSKFRFVLRFVLGFKGRQSDDIKSAIMPKVLGSSRFSLVSLVCGKKNHSILS